MTATRWVTRWRYEISAKPVLPGVWRRKIGGFLVRGKVTDPRTGQQHQLLKALDVATSLEARAWLDAEQRRIREGTPAARVLPFWSDFAVSLLERKSSDGSIKGAHTRDVWASTLKLHLFPTFGPIRVDELRRADVIAWKDTVARKIRAEEYSPHTANSWFGILRSVINAAVHEFELGRNPIAGVSPFDTSEHPAYTHEEPNALTMEEARSFLMKMRELCPQHFAMTALGFATGLRPSSLRPLRRHGENADVLWTEGVILIRRSHTRRVEVMNTTKTGHRQRIGLPTELMEILQQHVAELPDGAAQESELLFPTDGGKFRSPSVLDKPFAKVAKAIGLRQKITPRGMRRTFQDLARAAEIKDVVTRSISGHLTEGMQEHYSTPAETEQRKGLATIVDLAGMREALRAGSGRRKAAGV